MSLKMIRASGKRSGRVVPDVEVAPGAAGRGTPGALEPRVLVRGVVADELRDDPQAHRMGCPDEGAEVRHRPVRRMDVRVVGDVVAIVTQRGGIERQQPDRGDTQVAQVVELLDQAAEVARAVAGGIPEGPEVDLVDDRVAVPGGILVGTGLRRPGARATRGARCPAAACCAAGPRLIGSGVARLGRGRAGQATGRRSLALRVLHWVASYSSATEAGVAVRPPGRPTGRPTRRSRLEHPVAASGRPMPARRP